MKEPSSKGKASVFFIHIHIVSTMNYPITRYEQGNPVSPNLLKYDPLGFFFSNAASTTSVQAKAQFIRELITTLEELEEQAEQVVNKEKRWVLVGGIASIGTLTLSGALFPPLGAALVSASAVSAIGAIWQAVVNHNNYDPIAQTTKRYRLSLESAEASQWALLWHYAGDKLFIDALFTASKGLVAEGRLISRDNRPSIVKAVNYVADCQGIPFNQVDVSIKSLKAQALANVVVAPVPAQQPAQLPVPAPTYEASTPAAQPTLLQQPTFIQPSYEEPASSDVDVADLILKSVNSLAFIGGQRCGKSRLMAIASQYGLSEGKFKSVSVISALSKPGEDDQYWQHCAVQTHCDMAVTPSRERVYKQFLDTIRKFKASANTTNPQLLIIDEFAYLAECLVKDIKEKVQIAIDLMDEITNILSVVSSGGAKRGWYVWLGTPKGAIGSMGEAGRFMKGLSLVFAAIKPGETVDSNGVLVGWDESLFAATLLNFKGLVKPQEYECYDLNDRIVFLGGKWYNQTSYELLPLQPTPPAPAAEQQEPAPVATTQSDKAVLLLEQTSYKTLFEVVKYEMNVWDSEKVKKGAEVLARIILDRDLPHLKEKFRISNKHDARYSYPSYSRKLARMHQATNNICCCCLHAQSQEGHHTSYEGEEDQEGDNLYGLCKPCHDLSHTNENWVKDEDNPVWGNHSTAEWKAKLQNGYQLLSQRRVLAYDAE